MCPPSCWVHHKARIHSDKDSCGHGPRKPGSAHRRRASRKPLQQGFTVALEPVCPVCWNLRCPLSPVCKCIQSLICSFQPLFFNFYWCPSCVTVWIFGKGSHRLQNFYFLFFCILYFASWLWNSDFFPSVIKKSSPSLLHGWKILSSHNRYYV